MAVIQNLAFTDDTPDELKKKKYGEDWPVVYVINNDEEAYVGETINASTRAYQHLNNPERRKLKNLNIISDDKFNKSVILDLESYLISYMSADGRFKLQNGNGGLQNHNYYDKEAYEKTFSAIWEELREKNLAYNPISYIENSDIFKYSPYKALNLDQFRVVDSVIRELVKAYETGDKVTTVVKGGAGTGKTVLAVYLMKLLQDRSTELLLEGNEVDSGLHYVYENLQKLPANLKIGLVVPMQSLRQTIENVFAGVHGLKKKMVLKPVDVPKDTYDILIVDEAHRLRQRKALSQYPVFDKNNRSLGLDNSGTELDWVRMCSKHQILFYDSGQSVKPSDVDKEAFDELLADSKTKVFTLEAQFRCRGGNAYIDYIKCILSDNVPKEPMEFTGYDFKIFDDALDMVNAIKLKNEEYGLCRTVAGYSWDWISKKDKDAYDIVIETHKFRWNTVNKDWVNSPNAIDEIGCIHTIQGYDLNYAGVILGNEIKYDANAKKITIDKSKYKDLQGKTAVNEEGLKAYILNIYATMMTRGIRGTYVYACDKEMQKYLKQWIECV